VRPYLKKPFTKRAGGVAQGPEFKPQYLKTKQNNSGIKGWWSGLK
jgi:hypothetical protein